MAVVRPEFTVEELDWMVAQLELTVQTGQRAMKELKRAQRRGHEIEDADARRLDAQRAAMPTALHNRASRSA